jgi:hypothetical protein
MPHLIGWLRVRRSVLGAHGYTGVEDGITRKDGIEGRFSYI